ncbi:hypothetical protein MRS44_017910 [Fusarium solani]|uniref:uncharacterized protein n=1 Tax=Fusarium solani TaxID=169388 RepID=UPI0032C4A56F|nr:hypothetical protein MRS44_017910 [Fusarium solani]
MLPAVSSSEPLFGAFRSQKKHNHMPPHILNRPPIPYLRSLVGARPGHSISELYEPQASRAVLHAGLYVPAEFKNLGGNEAPQNMQPSVIGHKDLNRRPRKRSQSQAEKALLEFSATGQAVGSPKPRKRGRKPKKQQKEQKVASQQEELDADGLPKDPRRRRVIERNRIAATKCRARKRDEASALASREAAMEDQNRYLSTCVDSLNAEVYYLKTQLLRHTHCNCVLIHKYVAKEAKKCVGGLLACSSAFDTHGSSLSPNYGSPSDVSTAEELNMQGLEAGSFPPIWTNPFQQGSSASEVRDNMFDMGLEQFQTATMPPDSMVSAQPVPTLSLTECGLGQDVDVGPQEHQADEIAWDLYWQF